jgi:hypothetical protein
VTDPTPLASLARTRRRNQPGARRQRPAGAASADRQSPRALKLRSIDPSEGADVPTPANRRRASERDSSVWVIRVFAIEPVSGDPRAEPISELLQEDPTGFEFHNLLASAIRVVSHGDGIHPADSTRLFGGPGHLGEGADCAEVRILPYPATHLSARKIASELCVGEYGQDSPPTPVRQA